MRFFGVRLVGFTQENLHKLLLIWEEVVVPVKYGADRARAEEILLRRAEEATRELREISERERRAMSEEYYVDLKELDPRVFLRLTDNWVELAVRFVARAHGVRDLKDKISRAVLADFEKENIEIASATFEVVGFPKRSLTLS